MVWSSGLILYASKSSNVVALDIVVRIKGLRPKELNITKRDLLGP